MTWEDWRGRRTALPGRRSPAKNYGRLASICGLSAFLPGRDEFDALRRILFVVEWEGSGEDGYGERGGVLEG